MSSTYSTNLRTELIGSGDQAGTWGTTTNTSLGSILEQAIAGVSGGPYVGGTYPVVNFPTDADITLTANNGSVDQSRSAVLVVTSTGSLTATRNVIAPASASKVYIIKNSTTGGQSIQIKYATGSGVTIGNGQIMVVYGDGTNFYDGITALNNLTINGNLTVTGTSNIIPSGVIQMWATGTAPSGFLLCNGGSYSTSTYANLFTAIGYTFGGSSGTFLVPNYQNYMPIGAGSSYALAATGGSTTISSSNLPSHTHSFSGTSGAMNSNQSHSHSVNDPGHSHGLPQAGTSGPGSFYSAAYNQGYGLSVGTDTAVTNISINSANIDHTHNFSGTTGSTGSGTAFLPPYLAINFIIKT
jgi:microcystin-dependent protein